MIVPKQQYILIILVVFAYLIKYTAGWEWSQNLFISPWWSDMMILDVQVSSIMKVFPRKLKKKKKKNPVKECQANISWWTSNTDYIKAKENIRKKWVKVNSKLPF